MMERRFDEALWRNDVVLLHLIRTAALWRRQRALPAVLDMCDAISVNLRQVQREGSVLSPRTWRVAEMSR